MGDMVEVRLGRIRITDRVVDECEGVTPLVRIPRDQILRTRLAYGRVSEHPLFLVLVAVVCLALAVIGGVLVSRGEGFTKISGLCLSLVIPTPWLIAAALRRGPTLLVETARGTRRLGFGPGVELEQIRGFVEDAQSHAGFAIVAELPRAELR